MQQPPVWLGFMPLLVWFIIGIGLAIGNYFLARRLGANQVLWAVLSLIPIVNFVFVYYVGYRVVFAVLDRLAALGGRPEARPI